MALIQPGLLAMLDKVQAENKRETFWDVVTNRHRQQPAANGFMPQMQGENPVGAPDNRCHCDVCVLREVLTAEHSNRLRDVQGTPDELDEAEAEEYNPPNPFPPDNFYGHPILMQDAYQVTFK